MISEAGRFSLEREGAGGDVARATGGGVAERGTDAGVGSVMGAKTVGPLLLIARLSAARYRSICGS